MLQLGQEEPGNAPPPPARVEPQAPDLTDARADGAHPGPADRRSGGIAAAGHQKGPVRWVEHGRGEVLLCVVEEAVALDDLRLGLRHHPLEPIAPRALPGHHDVVRISGRGGTHTLYSFRRGRAIVLAA